MKTNKSTKRNRVSGSRAAPCSARVSVRLKVSDWEDLINFVNGDLANMPYEDPVGTQLRDILDAIRLSMAKAQNDKLTPLPGAETVERKGKELT